MASIIFQVKVDGKLRSDDSIVSDEKLVANSIC